jgi:hypothetical protein
MIRNTDIQAKKALWLSRLTPVTADDFMKMNKNTHIFHEATVDPEHFDTFIGYEKDPNLGVIVTYRSSVLNKEYTRSATGWFLYAPFRIMEDPSLRLEYQNTSMHEAINCIEEKRYRIPSFQRNLCWTKKQKISFIESAWKGFHLGYYMVSSYSFIDQENLHPNSDMLIDGQQRFDALSSYLNDEFPVLGYYWSETSVVDKRMFKTRNFGRCILHELDTEELKKFYDLLNFAGTPHTNNNRALGKFVKGQPIKHQLRGVGKFVQYSDDDPTSCIILLNNAEMIEVSLKLITILGEDN